MTWHIALGLTDIPHTRRTPAAPRARPTPAGREGSDSLGWQQTEYVESWLNNADKGLGWSGPQVRLTRPDLTLYRTDHFRPLAPNPSTPRLGPRRAFSGDLARSRAISELHATPLHPTPPHPPPRRAISGDLGASLARRHTCSKRKEVWRQEVTPHPERRRRRVFGPRVVARRLLRAGQQTIGRRDDAPSGTLPPPPGYCRTSALSGGIFPSRFLPWAPGNADGLPVPPPAPQSPP